MDTPERPDRHAAALTEVRAELAGVREDVRRLAGQIGESLERINRRLDEVNGRIHAASAHLEHVDERLEEVNGHLQEAGARCEPIDEHFVQVDHGFQRVDGRFDQLERRMDERLAQAARRIDFIHDSWSRRLAESEVRVTAAIRSLSGTLHDVQRMLADPFGRDQRPD
jgi:methyl-accepting chemotaxis protein